MHASLRRIAIVCRSFTFASIEYTHYSCSSFALITRHFFPQEKISPIDHFQRTFEKKIALATFLSRSDKTFLIGRKDELVLAKKKVEVIANACARTSRFRRRMNKKKKKEMVGKEKRRDKVKRLGSYRNGSQTAWTASGSSVKRDFFAIHTRHFLFPAR